MGALLQFFLSALTIIGAGVLLTRSADSISEKTGLGRLLVGSIFLAAATSMPELLVDLSAIKKGHPDIAVGDLMGSSLFNLLILATGDIVHRGTGKMFSRSASVHALSGVLSIHLTALAGLFIFLSNRFEHLRIGEVGVGPILILITYLLGARLAYKDQKVATRSAFEIFSKKKNYKDLHRPILGYILALITLIIAAPFMADAASRIAHDYGIGQTFVGTTLVALSTSLPELVVTISAVRMNAYDLAIANVFGSNCFNMVLLIPLDFFHSGPLLSSVSSANLFTALSIIVISSIAILGQLYHVEKRVFFIEPDAFTVGSLVLGSLWVLYLIG